MEMAWRDIARIMAHEIKNPLTPIRLTLDLLEEKIEAGELVPVCDQRKYLDRIVLQIEHLEKLVDQFRSFAREPEVVLARMELRQLLESFSAGMKPSIDTKISGSACATIDSRLFNQVLLNLWKNSAEAGATVLSVSLQERSGCATVICTDNGPGIPAPQLEKVWVPYVTFKKGGTGLGLPVVKRLVEAMHGEVGMQSICGAQDHGVTVTLRFPG
jgi:two-component system, NtrC family, nitrogen regulation sensor histidine kinase NtrY